MRNAKSAAMHFGTVIHADVPHGRNGKHKSIVTTLLSDLKRLQGDSALKVPLKELPDTKENIRSALNRASRKFGLRVATAADDHFLYIWNVNA